MQWLFDGSDESPDLPGLGLIRGRAVSLPASGLKVPHVGWNTVQRVAASHLLGTENETWAYFTHSYAVESPDRSVVAGETRYGRRFVSAIERGDVFGVQYHVEKSGDAGKRQLERFVERVRARSASPLAMRLIACLDVRDGKVVKGVRFLELRDAGDPAELARRYDAAGIDELVLLDVTATVNGRRALLSAVEAVANEVSVPFAVGGGVRSLDDARAVMSAGADKVAINSAALRDPSLITTIAGLYGSQAVVVAIDAKRDGNDYRVYGRSGTTTDGRDAVAWAREAASRGAGEILLTSIDRDGTRSGFDCELTASVSDAVPIPVIASGGAGSPRDFIDVFTTGRADAALAASVFHFGEHAIADLKRMLAANGITVREMSSRC
jgi:cyclase